MRGGHLIASASGSILVSARSRARAEHGRLGKLWRPPRREPGGHAAFAGVRRRIRTGSRPLPLRAVTASRSFSSNAPFPPRRPEHGVDDAPVGGAQRLERGPTRDAGADLARVLAWRGQCSGVGKRFGQPRRSRLPARMEITSRPAARPARRRVPDRQVAAVCQASTTVSAEARSNARSDAAVMPVRPAQDLRGIVVAANAGDFGGRAASAGQQASDHGRRHASGADKSESRVSRGHGRLIGWQASASAVRSGAARSRRRRHRAALPPSPRADVAERMARDGESHPTPTVRLPLMKGSNMWSRISGSMPRP